MLLNLHVPIAFPKKKVLRGIPGPADAAPGTNSRHGGARRHGAEPSVPGRHGAEPSVPTLAAQTVLRVRKGRPLPRLMYLLAYGRSTCPELASRVGTEDSFSPEVRAGRADEATPLRLPGHRHRQPANQPASRNRPHEAAQRRGCRSTSRNVRTSTTAVTTGFGDHIHPNGSPSS